MSSSLVHFRSCRSGEEVEAIIHVLHEHGITYQSASTAPNFDLTTIGSENDAQMIVLVRESDMAAATQAVADAEQESFEGPDEEHYFHDYRDDELQQVLVTSFEWSAHDVATARAILAERGNLPPEESIEEARDKYLAVLRQGTQSNRFLLAFGFLLATFGNFVWGVIPLGVVSALMGWSFLTMTKTDPLGVTYHVYDGTSRMEGKVLLCFSAGVLVIWAFIKLYRITNSP